MISHNSTFATTSNASPANTRGLLRIGDIAERFSLSLTTIRRATDSGELQCFTLPSGHRRFSLAAVLEWLGVEQEEKENEQNETDCPIAMVVRVSSDGQARKEGNSDKSSLEHQIERVESYCQERFGRLGKLYKSVGSGLNFDRPEFVRLVEDILAGKYRGGYIVATDFTRLCRFGIRMLEIICEQGGATIVYTMDEREEKTGNETLVDDVLSVLTHFTAKASGAKAAKVLKVNMPADLIKEAWQLEQQAYTIKDIAAEFNRRGLKTEKGKEYTPHIVKTCLAENRAILETDCGAIGPNTFELFVAEKIQENPAAKRRVDRKEIYRSYTLWCRRGNHYEINPVKLPEIIESQGWTRKLNKHKSVCYAGIELIG